MPSYKNLADVFQGGATTSQHVDATDDKHFADTTFLLKRTRSLGLLDEFITPGESRVKDNFITEETVNKINQSHHHQHNQQNSPSQDVLKHRLPKINTAIQKQPPRKASILYKSDSSSDDDDEDDDSRTYLPHMPRQPTIEPISESDSSSDSDIDSDTELKEDGSNGAPLERSYSHSPPPTTNSPEFLPHDDNDLLYEPQRHVDYLSHDWKESDIYKSWRYIVLRRKDVANSARLENASWRTWAQLKNHLKTVPPESVNWLKEGDVTWLYGPLYKEPGKSEEFSLDEEPEDKQKPQKPAVHNNNIINPLQEPDSKGPKPILKKRTAAEMMLSQLEFMKLSLLQSHHKQWDPHSGSPILELINHNSASPPSIKQHDLTSRTASPISLSSPLVKTASNQVEQSTDSVATSHLSETGSSKKDRHIHFSDTVKQCIAIDVESEGETRDHGDDDDDSSSSDDSDDEGGFCLNVRSPSSAFLYQQAFSNAPNQKEDESLKSKESVTSKLSNHEQYQTIALLPPTHLNYKSTEDESEEEEEEEKEYTSVPFYDNRVSHNVHTSRNYDYHYNYDYNSIYPTSSQHETSIINDTANDNLKVYDIPDNLDLGSIMQIEDVDEPLSKDVKMFNIDSEESESNQLSKSSSSSSLMRSDSGYNIKEQQPLPPFQSNTSASGFFKLDNEDEESHDEDSDEDVSSDNNNDHISVNQRLQRISSAENSDTSYSKLSTKTKDLANLFLGNWKKQ